MAVRWYNGAPLDARELASKSRTWLLTPRPLYAIGISNALCSAAESHRRRHMGGGQRSHLVAPLDGLRLPVAANRWRLAGF